MRKHNIDKELQHFAMSEVNDIMWAKKQYQTVPKL